MNTNLQTFEDASDAAALITVDGFTFAFHLVGEVRGTMVAGRNAPGARKRALKIATHFYTKALAALPADYLERNRALYAAAA